MAQLAEVWFAVQITFVEIRTDGSCPDTYTLARTWIVTDRCLHSTSATQVITVRDTQAPVLVGVPPDVTVECDAVPPPATPTATDNCDPNPMITFVEVRTDGSCPDSYTLTRTWTVTDRCLHSTSATQVITVRDTQAPVLVGVPPDVTVECDAVPPPATPTATDNCDPDPTVTFVEIRTDGSCPNNSTLTRTWTATDRCLHTTIATQTVTVRDTTGPVIDVEPTLGCCAILWPPMHGYVDFKLADTGIVAHDACGDVTLAFSTCHSSQPENTTGDGNSMRDCVMDGDQVHLRAERRGDCKKVGRTYTMTVDAVDSCGNVTRSAPFQVCVPHDWSDKPSACSRVYRANPGSHQPDYRPGTNGGYGVSCGDGCAASCSSP